MRRILLSVLCLLVVFSGSAFAKAGNLGVEYTFLSDSRSLGQNFSDSLLYYGFTTPSGFLVMPKISLVYDITDQIVASIGFANVKNVSFLSMWGAYDEAFSGTCITVAGKYRIKAGALSPTVGMSASTIAGEGSDQQVLESATGSIVTLTAGLEYIVVPNLLLVADLNVYQNVTGTFSIPGAGTYQLDSETNMLSGGSVGIRYYVL